MLLAARHSRASRCLLLCVRCGTKTVQPVTPITHPPPPSLQQYLLCTLLPRQVDWEGVLIDRVCEGVCGLLVVVWAQEVRYWYDGRWLRKNSLTGFAIAIFIALPFVNSAGDRSVVFYLSAFELWCLVWASSQSMSALASARFVWIVYSLLR